MKLRVIFFEFLFFHKIIGIFLQLSVKRADFDENINQEIMKLAVVTFHLHHTKFDARARRSIAIVFYLQRMNK